MVTFVGTPKSFAQYVSELPAISSGAVNVISAEADNDVARLGISAFAQTILDDANAAAVLTTIGAQAADAQLAAIAALAPGNGHFTRWTGESTAVSQAMLGTVSQSGGTPTGAIAERGSNANGEYVKYFDGRLECTFTDAGVQDTSTAYGNIFGYATSSTWTFPATFIAAPIVTPGQVVLGRWLAVNPPTTTTVAYRQYSATSSAATQVANLKAIGRWF